METFKKIVIAFLVLILITSCKKEDEIKPIIIPDVYNTTTSGNILVTTCDNKTNGGAYSKNSYYSPDTIFINGQIKCPLQKGEHICNQLFTEKGDLVFKNYKIIIDSINIQTNSAFISYEFESLPPDCHISGKGIETINIPSN